MISGQHLSQRYKDLARAKIIKEEERLGRNLSESEISQIHDYYASKYKGEVKKVRFLKDRVVVKDNKEYMYVSTEVHNVLTSLKTQGESFDTIIRMLLNVFNDPHMKSVYEKKYVSEEFYRRTLDQRKIEKLSYLKGIKPEDLYNFDKEGKAQVPRFKFDLYDNKKLKKPPDMVTNIKMQYYDVETLAWLKYLLGITSINKIYRFCIRYTYMMFSTDRLLRNISPEISEKTIMHMMKKSIIKDFRIEDDFDDW